MSHAILDSHLDLSDAEQNGLARAFIHKMARATQAAISEIVALAGDAFTTLERRHRASIQTMKTYSDIRRVEKGGLRPDYLTSLEARYRRIPALGCVGIKIERPDKYSITITDIRINERRITKTDWPNPDNPEFGAVLTRNVLTLTRDRADKASTVLVSLSLHALSRRFRRGFDIQEAAIVADLASLAAAAPALIEKGPGPFNVPAKEGEWRGEVADLDDAPTGRRQLSANVRTFV